MHKWCIFRPEVQLLPLTPIRYDQLRHRSQSYSAGTTTLNIVKNYVGETTKIRAGQLVKEIVGVIPAGTTLLNDPTCCPDGGDTIKLSTATIGPMSPSTVLTFTDPDQVWLKADTQVRPEL